MHRMTSTQARHTRRGVLQAAADANARRDSSDREHMSVSILTPRAGTVDDVRREDDARGYERDETDQFHQAVRDLVLDGDRRAHAAGRQTRRTLAEMAPGQTLQPVLRMTRQLTFTPTTASRAGADDACGLCGYWKCRCGGVAPAPSMRAADR